MAPSVTNKQTGDLVKTGYDENVRLIGVPFVAPFEVVAGGHDVKVFKARVVNEGLKFRA